MKRIEDQNDDLHWTELLINKFTKITLRLNVAEFQVVASEVSPEVCLDERDGRDLCSISDKWW